MIHERIISAVDIHRKAMELAFIRILIEHIILVSMLIRKIANILFSCHKIQKSKRS